MHRSRNGYDGRKVGFLLGLCVLLYAAPSFGERANNLNLMPGLKGSGMGGAFVSIVDDPTATYYNPAGLALNKANSGSLTTTASHESETVYDEVLGNKNFSDKSRSIIPTFLGTYTKFGPLALGLSYLTKDSVDIHHTDIYSSEISGTPTSYERTHQLSHQVALAGPSIALRLGQNIAVGVSGFYLRRQIRSVTQETTEIRNLSTSIATYRFESTTTGAFVVAGCLFTSGSWSFGVARRWQQNTDTNGDYSSSVAMLYPGSGADSVQSTEGQITADTDKIPEHVQVGFNYHPTPNFTLAFDSIYYASIPAETTNIATEPVTSSFATRAIQDFALGLEYRTNMLAFRSAVFTNNSIYARPITNQNNQPTSIDYRGASFGVSFISGATELGFTLQRQWGLGESQIITDNPAIQPARAKTILLSVGVLK